MEVLKKTVSEISDCLVEACVSTSVNERVSFSNNSFNEATSGDSFKLEVRVSKGTRSAYAWTNNPLNWRECVLRAKKLMLASNPLKAESSISDSKSISESFVNKSLLNKGVEFFKDKGELMINQIKDQVNVPNLVINKSLITEEFMNSNLINSKQDSSSLSVSLECSKLDSSSFDMRTSAGANIDFSELSSSTARMCVDSLKPKKLKPGLFNVVFDFNAISELISILTPSLLANNILDNNSRLVDKLGAQVINKDLTIRDVPVIKGGVMNSSIDYEGVISSSKKLFNKGVLDCFINDLYTANRMGVKPTGNSAGLVKRGLVSPANIVIDNGSANSDELLTDCVYVNALMGTHTANIVTGDFALNALNAFKYDAKGVTPIRDVMISANIFDLLNKPVLIGKESRFDAGLKTPLLRFEGVQVVG